MQKDHLKHFSKLFPLPGRLPLNESNYLMNMRNPERYVINYSKTTLNKRRTCPNYYEWKMVLLIMPPSHIENICTLLLLLLLNWIIIWKKLLDNAKYWGLISIGVHANNQNCTQSNRVKTRDCSLLKLIAIDHTLEFLQFSTTFPERDCSWSWSSFNAD